MRRSLVLLAAISVIGCGGGGIDGDWQINFSGTCTGEMSIQGPDGQLTGSWRCSNAAGNVTGSRNGNVVWLTLSAAILQYPMNVTATLDGSSLTGTVQAQNYPSHQFIANR